MKKKTERVLAKLRDFDIGIEDHGMLVMWGTFETDGTSQGLGYCIEAAFLYRFLDVFNVERLQDVNGMSCWITRELNGPIIKIEPLHKNDGNIFDIREWGKFVGKSKLPSPYELRTGKKT